MLHWCANLTYVVMLQIKLWHASWPSGWLEI